MVVTRRPRSASNLPNRYWRFILILSHKSLAASMSLVFWLHQQQNMNTYALTHILPQLPNYRMLVC
jgi:hypothetical protein